MNNILHILRNFLFILNLSLLLIACGQTNGSGRSGAVGSTQITINPATANTAPPIIQIFTNCAGNPGLGTWVSETDPFDTIVITADCKMLFTKCGLITSYRPDGFTLNNSSFQIWTFDFGTNDPSCYPDGGVYTTPVRTLTYRALSAHRYSIQWRGIMYTAIFDK